MSNKVLNFICVVIDDIEKEIKEAFDEYDESRKIASKSYGCGFDLGYYEGLSRACEIIRSELEMIASESE